ncbi:MAG: GNAT family N-acetyltransferase [Pseudomonadales bacterium]
MTVERDSEAIYPRPLYGAAPTTQPSGKLPERVGLAGELVTLEPLDPVLHAQELYEQGHSCERGLAIWDYLAYGPWPDLESYRATLVNQAASFDPIFYAIRLHSSGKVCGQISIMDINGQNGSAEIGHIWFGPSLQKTRAATEALFLAMDYPMTTLGYRRMQWRCNSLNKGSRNAARRLGFRFEGIFYNNLIFKGQNRDTAWYSILDDEWPEVREKLTRWLADDNFDAQGVAVQSLSALMQVRKPSSRRLD